MKNKIRKIFAKNKTYVIFLISVLLVVAIIYIYIYIYI